jgi:hypothetical protein
MSHAKIVFLKLLTWKITKVLLIGNKNITMKNWKLMEKEANSN